MEIAINRDKELQRVLIFDDWNDPYQMQNIPYQKNQELFAELCDVLRGKLEEANDIWYREGIMEHLLQDDDSGKK